MLAAASLSSAAVAYNTIYAGGAVERAALSPDVATSRADADRLGGVHASAADPLAQRVLAAVPELASWEEWYAHPRAWRTGICTRSRAAKLRRTRAVRYYRDLVPTPDGGTLAIDLLAGVRRAAHANARSASSSLFTGGALPGAAEEEGFTQFVDTPPPFDASRPLLLLASGLGGGSQDTYVRSMAAAAAERGWQVAVLNMRGCGSSPVTSPRLFSAYRGANDDVRTAVAHLRATRLGAGGVVAALGWSNSGTIVNNVMAEQATTHAGDPSHAIDAAVACATPLNMPANSANLQRPFHSAVYDVNLGKSLRTLGRGAAAVRRRRDRPLRAGAAVGRRLGEFRRRRRARARRAFDPRDRRGGDASAVRVRVRRRLLRRRELDQRLGQIAAPLLLLNAFDDPIVPGWSLCRALDAARANPQVVVALTSHGGHLGWCDRGDPWGGPRWTERVCCASSRRPSRSSRRKAARPWGVKSSTKNELFRKNDTQNCSGVSSVSQRPSARRSAEYS